MALSFDFLHFIHGSTIGFSMKLNPIVRKQGALLLKEVVNYTLFMAKTAENLTLWGCMYLYMAYERVTLGTLS